MNNAVTSLTSDLHNRLQSWEGQVETQIDSGAFEKKWEDKIVQLEPGSKEGAITNVEHLMRMSVQRK